METPLRIVLNRELALRHGLVPRKMAGADVVRLAAAIGAPDIEEKRSLGLGGAREASFADLLLRHGHCPAEMLHMLTCTDARRRMTAAQDLDVLADHLRVDGPLGPGRPALLEVLLKCGDLARRADPDWLRARLPDFWLAVALDRGGHYATLDVAWLGANLGTDESLTYALSAGGYLASKRVTPQWLADRVRDGRQLLHALKLLDDRVSADWLAETFGHFPDFVDAACAVSSSPLSIDDVVRMYNRRYRGSRKPYDLAEGALLYALSGPRLLAMDVGTVFKELAGCCADVVASIIDVAHFDERSVERFAAPFMEGGSCGACARAIEHHGWSSEDAAALAACLTATDDDVD
jgi:hypothetical protein